LVPLRRIDVVEATKANGLDPDALLHEIDGMEAVPLAIKPVTLGFLLNTYRRTGRFPRTQAALYLEGCRLLCEETNEDRRDARLTSAIGAEELLAVAAHIAAVTVFANRYAVWTGLDRGDVATEDVSVRELCVGTEEANGRQFEVTEAAIKSTLGTGLFSSRGAGRLGWAHQTYAEFLAAWYLLQHQMSVPQMMDLIVHPGDPDGKLVPQLHETAAWLAGMVPDVFRLMRIDPQVLLRSDVASADVVDRAVLVETLLKLYDEERLLDRDLDVRGRYCKLAHPGLASQLRPYICDRAKGIIVRRVASDIAEACELGALQNDLANIALDPSQPMPVRINAAYAIGRIGDDDAKAKLKPLAIGEAGDDPDDELKGCGLRAVWPTHITAEELFRVITPPKRDSLLGAYKWFLNHELVQHLHPPDLPVALRWVCAQQQHRALLPHPFRELMDAIMLQAWERLEFPGVLEPFAKAALSRLMHHDEIVRDRRSASFGSVLDKEDGKRRKLLVAMLPMLSGPKEESFTLVYSGTPMVLARDIPWMIERLQQSTFELEKMTLAQFINGYSIGMNQSR
jgi:predicted NACHT family NTPase